MSIKISGFPVILFLVFMILKLCSVITWSWLWVFSPLWIPFAVVVCFAIVLVMIDPSLVQTIFIRKRRK